MTPTVTPNSYQFSSPHLHLTYTTTSFDGKPTMTYQDPRDGKSYRGDEIRAVETDLGLLVSVTIRMTIDSGSTSCSVFIPRMRITQGAVASVQTECVITVHKFSIIPQLLHGQLDTYTVVAMHGTAQYLVF